MSESRSGRRKRRRRIQREAVLTVFRRHRSLFALRADARDAMLRLEHQQRNEGVAMGLVKDLVYALRAPQIPPYWRAIVPNQAPPHENRAHRHHRGGEMA